MTDFSEYFTPVDLSKINDGAEPKKNTIRTAIHIYSEKENFPDIDETHIAIIGVEEERKSANNTGTSHAPDTVRTYLYNLSTANLPYTKNKCKAKITDFGNIKPGHNIEDTYFALQDVVNRLLRVNIVPLIIGGSQDITFPQYLGYKEVEATINIVSIDNSFDLGDADDEFSSKSWLGKIILHQPNHLFNFSNIGYQSHFVDQRMVDLMNKLHFDAYRLGAVQKNIEEVEPIVRNADLITFDVSSIRQSDAPGNNNATPNGFYGEEACAISRYAGISDKVTSIGFYELNPKWDKRGHTAHLVAQMIWYFLEGYYTRKKDFPFRKTTDYTKYRVSIKDLKHEIVFYKSKKSDRWWMEVPYPADKRLKFERHLVVPCSYEDYQTAIKHEELPDRWWLTQQKLS